VEDVILWCWKFRAIALRYVNSYFKRSETQFVLWCMQFEYLVFGPIIKK
jgi:hypothetical protein